MEKQLRDVRLDEIFPHSDFIRLVKSPLQLKKERNVKMKFVNDMAARHCANFIVGFDVNVDEHDSVNAVLYISAEYSEKWLDFVRNDTTITHRFVNKHLLKYQASRPEELFWVASIIRDYCVFNSASRQAYVMRHLQESHGETGVFV
jgi:methyltransferase-like protein